MANTIHNHFSLGKFGAMLFARQSPMVGAERHKGLLEQFSEWREHRAATRELSGLSDRELADIGLTRQEISAAVGRVQK